jgi:hypothetical protein
VKGQISLNNITKLVILKTAINVLFILTKH